MDKNIIHFKNFDWEKPKEGVKQKIYIEGNKKLRLLRFYDSFIEKEWCLNGHIGYVLEGEMNIVRRMDLMRCLFKPKWMTFKL